MQNLEKEKISYKINPFLRFLLITIVFTVTFVFFSQKIVFVNADLGRHLENGKVFFQHFVPISTNYYSYTEPDFPVINHHWGSGVLFYLIYKAMGFKGLSVFYCLISAFTVLLFYLVAERRSHSYIAFLFFMLCIPLIADRVEIRPELFSMLLLGAYVFLFERYKSTRKGFKSLLILIPLMQLFWVNLHLFFIMGLLLVLIYGLDAIINRKEGAIKNFGILMGLSGLACLLNPAGIRGALAPLTIFNNYAYMIAENQSITFMQKRFSHPVYLHFEFVTLAVIIIAFLLGYKHRAVLKTHTSELLCLLLFSLLAFKAIRGIPIASCFFIAFAPVIFFDLVQSHGVKIRKKILRGSLVFSLLLLIISTGKSNTYMSAIKEHSGFGLYTEVNNSAKFFKSLQLTGPVFNNYDIGGYLIFALFPKERVFVDNRPEAYSANFFDQVYNPILEKEEVWRKADSSYHFNCIYFFRLDATPFGQPFLIRRLSDHTNWAPIYVDAATIIFLRRNDNNKAVIEKYELPQNIFQPIQNTSTKQNDY